MSTGMVLNVIVAEDDFLETFVDNTPGTYIKTSYNTRGGVHYEPDSDTPSADQSKALRKNFASTGGTYDADRDAFIPVKPYPSWVLDEDTCMWAAPVDYPEDDGGVPHFWNEDSGAWQPRGY